MDNQQANEIATNTFFEIGRALFNGVSNQPADVSAEIEFDGQQRASKFANVLVDGMPVIPSAETITAINEKAAELLNLPEMYKIKSLTVTATKSGQLNCVPTYLS
ncbi:MAG TPA: hypothetical protein VEC17_01470 [Candidatus Binatia bacterium]|nr:hypothetical protein [Candidatus Binatia bacterium]